MQSAIIVMCPFICPTTAPKYQLSNVANVEYATEALEEELEQ